MICGVDVKEVVPVEDGVDVAVVVVAVVEVVGRKKEEKWGGVAGGRSDKIGLQQTC